MRQILHIELNLADSDFWSSHDISDLEITSTVQLSLQEKYEYTTQQTVEDSILTITEQEYVPNDKDKLYFLPGVSVPRIKLKDLATTRGIKTTRKIEDANAIFASRATIGKLTENTWRNYYKTEDVKAFVEAGKDYFDSFDYGKLMTALEFYTEDIITTDYSGVRIFSNEYIPFAIKVENSNERFLLIKEENSEVCIALESSQIATIYDESKILAHVNGDNCVTIDHDMYINLHDMFESSDSDNHILAMEIMANSNYIESLLYIEMLFMNHSHQMDRKEKNHVNFKSLLAYLKKDKSYMSTDLDKVMLSLREKGIFTRENVEKLMDYEAKKHLSLSGSYTYFSIKSVSLKPEYLSEIKSDLDFILQDDYVPVIEEAPTFDNTTVDDQEELEETPPTMEETYDLVEEQQAEEFGEITEEVSETISKDVEEELAEEPVDFAALANKYTSESDEPAMEVVDPKSPEELAEIANAAFDETGVIVHTKTLTKEECIEEYGEFLDPKQREAILDAGSKIKEPVPIIAPTINLPEENNHQDALDKASEKSSEEFIEYPEITDEEAEHNIKAQEEIDMIENEEIIEEREADDMIVEQHKFDEYDL